MLITCHMFSDLECAFLSSMQLSSELSAFMGTSTSSPNIVLKEVWAYIKNHKLQDPLNRTEIVCNDTFEKLFHRKRFSMLKISKYLNNVSNRRTTYLTILDFISC